MSAGITKRASDQGADRPHVAGWPSERYNSQLGVGLHSPFLVAVPLAGPTVAQLDVDRFRVNLVFDDTRVRGNLAAQEAVARMAHEPCRGRVTAVSDGTVELRDAHP